MDVQEKGKNLITPEFKEKLASLTAYLIKHLGIQKLPILKFASSKENANDILGYTGYYDHNANKIVVYVTDRHPKDILRTVAHELIHCWQKEHGNLHNHTSDPQYAQHDPQLRRMEMQAYLLGNILFRDWSDFYKHGNENIHFQGKLDTQK